MKSNRPSQSGFAALMSAIIISFVALDAALLSSAFALQIRSHALHQEYKVESEALALSCLNRTLLELILTENYLGHEMITIGKKHCIVRSITHSESDIRVETEGSVQNFHTRLLTSINPISYTIIKICEVPFF